MRTFYVVLLIVGSRTLYSKVSQLVESIQSGNREKISVDVFFLLITLALIAGLIVFEEY